MPMPIRWGILGAGQVARGFAQGLRALPDARLVAVASRTAANAQSFARRYGVPQVHSSFADLVRDPQVDVVYVATPHHRHMEDCLLCLEHGKAVLCEKPFTVNARQARAVIDAARRQKRFCMEAMWMRFTPAVRKAHELVARGAIGELRMLQADFGVANQFDPNSRLFDPRLAGGALLDLGVYPLSLAVMLLGIPEHITTQAAIGMSGVDDQAAIVLGYPHGQLAVLSTSLRTFSPTEAVIMGSRGAIRIHGPLYCPRRLTISTFSEVPAASIQNGNANGRLISALKDRPLLRGVAARAKNVVLPLLGRGGRTINLPVTGNGYNYEAAEVMRCLRAGELESPLLPLDESYRIMELMDHIRSAWGLYYPEEEACAVPPVEGDGSQAMRLPR